jgi:hypothetical protein
MPQIVRVGIFLILMLSTKAFSQNYFNSPYTRHNIGDLIDDGFAYNRSLGGSTIGIRPHNQINYLNPASYTNQDTNSVLFQIGFTGRLAKVSSELDHDKSVNFNVEYLNLGFPVTRWWNMSIGMTPFSRVQYFSREQTDSTALGERMTFDYNGFGGFNQFYFGNAIKIGKILSLGANVAYLFGSLDKTQKSYLTDLSSRSARMEIYSNQIARDFYIKLGAQLHPKLNDKNKLVIGATYDFKTNIDEKVKGKTLHFNEFGYSDNSNYWLIYTLELVDTNQSFTLPAKLGIGVSYNYNDVIMVTGEYIRQDWTNAETKHSNFGTGVYESLRFGLEVVPDPLSNKIHSPYYKRMHYRAGYYHTNTYLTYNDKNISDWGFTAGLGFPIKYDRKGFFGTTFDIGYQYGVRGTTANGLIQENIQIITFGLTLHDFWFMKPKYD